MTLDKSLNLSDLIWKQANHKPPSPPPAGLCCLLNKISGVDQIAESPREAQQCPRADVESEELDGVPFRRCFLPVFLLPFLVFSEWSFFSGSS